jgi:hypothetical protein
MEYRYKLNSKRGKFTCPKCGSVKRFTRYVDTLTNALAPEIYGVCDRLNNCGYSLYPVGLDKPVIGEVIRERERPISYIPYSTVELSQTYNNIFSSTIIKKYKLGLRTTKLYKLGDSRYTDWCTFWYIDQDGNVRTGKRIRYGSDLKRIKGSSPLWEHTALNKNNNKFNMKLCYFGQHLLDDKPICIVESEKTAVIMACLYPNKTWLGTGGILNFSVEKNKFIRDYDVTVFPDNGGFERWSRIVSKSNFRRAAICSVMELYGDGMDIGDLFL